MPGFVTIESLRRRSPIILVLIVACALLTGCGSDNKDEPDVTVTDAPTATADIVPTALSGSPEIGAVVWTNAIATGTNAPIGTTPPAVTDSTIYAVFPVESLPAGSQLVGSWFFNNTSLDGLNSAMRIDNDQVAGWIEFHIERTGSDPWPGGVYEIVVTDGTTELQRAEITIS